MDKNFPRDDSSLCNETTNEDGRKAFESKAALEAGRSTSGGVEWKRIENLFTEKDARPCLFSGEIEPADIDQGGLGDCWLMASFAALSMCPGAIQQCFLTKEYNHRGMYEVRLYDARKEQFVTLVVDDYVPCHKGTNQTLFANPHGTELWVLILEKAFAKLLGSFYGLDGGSTAWALQALTGDRVHMWNKKADGWHESEMMHSARDHKEISQKRKALAIFEEALKMDPDDKDTQQRIATIRAEIKECKRKQVEDQKSAKINEVIFYATEAKGHPESAIFTSIQVWRYRGFVITAGSSSSVHKHNGIRAGHAYSVFAAIEEDGVQLVRLQVRRQGTSFTIALTVNAHHAAIEI